jgi:hypothetical protein
MDLGRFATRDNCENGVWHEPVIFGNETGIELCLLGEDSDTARKYEAAQLRELQGMTVPQRARINVVERNRDVIVNRTVGLRVKGDESGELSVTINGEVIEDTPSGYRKLYFQIPEIESWAREVTGNRKNFLPKEKANSKEPSDASSSSTTTTTSEPESHGE